jgi:prepilin-type N-terminal cleavage/methylation domain-containing protein
MQLPFSDSPGHVRLGTNTDTKNTNCSPRRTKILSKQHTWYAFRRTVFAHGVGAQRCSGSRVGCDHHYSIERQTRYGTSPPGWRTSNSPEDESTRVADIKHCSRAAFTLLRQRERVSAFTLIELLVVMAIIAILLALIAPAFTSMKSSGDFNNAVYGIQGLLENARTYAKANRTYVFVGFTEVNSSVDASASPQVAGVGRVAVAIVASKDGTRQFNYATSCQGSDWTANYSNGAQLVAIGKLQRYENLHFLVDFGSWAPSAHPNSKMARYQPPGGTNIYTLGSQTPPNPPSVTPFTWPLGSPLDSGYQYRFDRVIYFDPTGIARIANRTNADEIAHVMEIDLQPTHGTIVPPNPTNQDVENHAVIQLGTTDGAVRVYRP